MKDTSNTDSQSDNGKHGKILIYRRLGERNARFNYYWKITSEDDQGVHVVDSRCGRYKWSAKMGAERALAKELYQDIPVYEKLWQA